MSTTTLAGKKGACYVLRGDDGIENLQHVKSLQPLYWNYGWCDKPVDCQPSCTEFVPMVWGGSRSDELMQEKLDGIAKLIEEGKCKRVLGFNEPDKKEQSNMSVERVLHYWPMLEALNVPLCSPSCANPLSCTKAEDSCQGVSGCWMRNFMSKIEANGMRVDYIGVHWYGGPNFSGFANRMKQIYEAHGGKYPLLLTEFAVADWKAMNKCISDNCYTQSQVLAFVKKALPWLEEQDWIAGYAWFPFKPTCPQGVCSSLHTKKGKLTALGRYYASITNDNPSGNQNEKVYCE